MNQVDITIHKRCSTCRTETPLRYLDNFVTLGEHSTLEVRIDPDEFLLCTTCKNPLRIRIQCHPYELVNHLDNPVAMAMYQQSIDEGRSLLP